MNYDYKKIIMNQSKQLRAVMPALSITNFDLPSLHLLHREISITLKDAEIHLSEFNDNEQRALLLMDSIEVLKQLSCIFELLSLTGAQVLNSAIEQGLQQLYDNEDNTNARLIMDLSEAIMTLDRYVEFVLLTETVEPTLLLPIINKLYAHEAKAAIGEDYFASFGSSSVVIANPEQNFEPLTDLNLNTELLTHAYRSGLAVVLTNRDGVVSADDTPKLEAMSAACNMIAAHTDSLFWQAASAIVTDIEAILPLDIRYKHTLIYLEQQFQSYLPVVDSRFADLVSLACQRDHASAKQLCAQYASNTLDRGQREQMRRFLFGPNRQLVDTVNTLTQSQINTIKDKIDSYLQGDLSNSASSANSAQAKEIAHDLMELSSTVKLLSLEAAAVSLSGAAEAVTQWQQPSPDDIDQLLLALMSAENAIIAMAEIHTPGEVYLPLNNDNISLHQLNSAYKILVTESRSALVSAEQAINNYLLQTERDHTIIQELPEMMYQVAGAMRFLQLSTSATMLSQLAKFLAQRLAADLPIEEEMLANIADVMMSVDYHLEGFEYNRPVSKQALDVGQQSLSHLLVA